MNLVFFDDQETVTNLRPFTFTRPISDIRLGILTIREKWHHFLDTNQSSNYTEDHLRKKFPLNIESENLCINSSIIPDQSLVALVKGLAKGQILTHNGKWLAGIFTADQQGAFEERNSESFEVLEYKEAIDWLQNPWDIFSICGKELVKDYELLTHGRSSQPISETVTVIGDPSMIFISPGAKVEAATLNTTSGPIFLDENAEIMEGALVRGPFALGKKSQLKLGAKVYGPTSIGPQCKVAGEVNNSVFFGFSNKAHDGFLGNSVLGEWCNLGADTNNSNLKNNYAEVKVWHFEQKRFVKTGLQFCGLLMGDHSKCGINTMFNTGTVIGVSANIFGAGFPRTYIPSFSWGGAAGFTPYKLPDAIATAERVYARRSLEFGEADQEIFEYLFKQEYPDA